MIRDLPDDRYVFNGNIHCRGLWLSHVKFERSQECLILCGIFGLNEGLKKTRLECNGAPYCC